MNLSDYDSEHIFNLPVIGERKLLYKCFLAVFENRMPQSLQDLLYFYLLTRVKVRNYLIQPFGQAGFSKFEEYDNRKSAFLLPEYKNLVPYYAVSGTLYNESVTDIELRVAPAITKEKIVKDIREWNTSIGKNGGQYIFHFIKEADYDSCGIRHKSLREKLEKQAAALQDLLLNISYYPDIHIIGIDAANSEFKCRPEVFAPAYKKIQELRNVQLGMTFHVGEDFYDIVDGLRAIDEAIKFLHLSDGARLGHAVALGLDVRQYYESRSGRILVPAQVLLDNYAWMLTRMDEFGIGEYQAVYHRFKNEYRRLVRHLYEDYYPLEDYMDAWALRE